MKSYITNILGGMSLACILLSSCRDDNQMIVVENETLPENVPASVYERFLENYPEAADAQWSVEDGYAVATFSAVGDDTENTSVWYGLADAKKRMQCRTIAFADLPDAVRSAFANSDCAAWTPNAFARLLTRYTTGTAETIYILWVKGSSDNGTVTHEAILYYTAAGVLIKRISEVTYDTNYRFPAIDYKEWLSDKPLPEPDHTDSPSQPKTDVDVFIQEHYPQAVITDRDYDKEKLEVELAYDGAEIKVSFELRAGGYVWTESEWDLNWRQAGVVPTSIQETLDSAYPAYQLYFLKYHEKADNNNYYMAGLKSALLKQEMKVKMDAHGTVLAEYGRH